MNFTCKRLLFVGSDRLGKNFPLGDIIEGKLEKLIAELVEFAKQEDLKG